MTDSREVDTGALLAIQRMDMSVIHPRDGATSNCINEYKRIRARARSALIEIVSLKIRKVI